MAEAVKEEGTRHVLADCYCDDWCFAEAKDTARGGVGEGNDTNDASPTDTEKDENVVAKMMLKQVHSGGGSMLCSRMPQQGFRESCLDALEEILEGPKQRHLRYVCLAKMEQVASC